MKIILESDSLIQFIIATHLRTTVFENDIVDLVMYDSMPNAKAIFDNIKKSGLFRNCYLVTSVLAVGKSKLGYAGKVKKVIRWIEMLFSPARGVKREIDIDDAFYDCFCFCANGIFIDGLYNVCKKINPDIKCYRYEGSLTSYLYDHENRKGKFRYGIEKIIKKMSNGCDLAADVERYYFFEPELIQFEHRYQVVKMDKIIGMDDSVKEILNNIFEFDENSYIGEDYIAFEDGNLFYMNNDEEVELFESASDILNDEFVVKLHPRRNAVRYKKSVKINRSFAPWEIFLMNQDMKGKTLITASSGSIFTTLVYFGMSVNIILLYKCLDESVPLVGKEFERLFLSISDNMTDGKIYIPDSKEELLSLLHQLDEK